MEIYFKKCPHCGHVDYALKKGEFYCCGKEMIDLLPDTEEAAVEKHKPTYRIDDNKIIAEVNHVMEEEHKIEWIMFVGEKQLIKYNLSTNEPAKVTFNTTEKGVIYSYCNKHGLWQNEVK